MIVLTQSKFIENVLMPKLKQYLWSTPNLPMKLDPYQKGNNTFISRNGKKRHIKAVKSNRETLEILLKENVDPNITLTKNSNKKLNFYYNGQLLKGMDHYPSRRASSWQTTHWTVRN